MNPTFQLIDSGWDKVFAKAVATECKDLRVSCPFIKLQTAKRLLTSKCPDLIHVITRFHLGEMNDGVSDTGALRLLLQNGAKIRGIRHLHSKLYLFGKERAIVTSANLTEAALLRNHEFGFVCTEGGINQRCREYFDSLWKRGGPDLDLPRIEEWERRIAKARLLGARPHHNSGLSDEGADAGLIDNDIVVTHSISGEVQTLVKFLGGSNNRADRSITVVEELRRSGSHWACCYPLSKRPVNVDDGAVIFMGRFVSKPDDVLIYGRAIGMKHDQDRDQASPNEIATRAWKKDYPHYIRVHHGEFLAGFLKDGISLNQLMNDLGSDGFASTYENKKKGEGNVIPRMAIRQQPSVRLSQRGFEMINARLESAFGTYGKLLISTMEKLDWPEIIKAPDGLSEVGRVLLRALVGKMKSVEFDPDQPKTFLTYTDVLLAMGVEPWEVGRLGPQFERHGGGDLNGWLKENGFPAATGLVVKRGEWVPGGDYFKSNNRAKEDYGWWIREMKKSASFDWSQYL